MLVVDTREPKFIDTDFTRAYLSRGDYAIIRKDGTCAALIERKTCYDYVASIQDGRIKSIETKLLGVGDKTYLILEDSFPEYIKFHGIAFKSVLKSCARISQQHGIIFVRTESFEDTLNYIKKLVVTLGEDFGVAPIPTILQTVVRKTEEEIIIEALCGSMKNVGEKTARLIMQHGSLNDHITNAHHVEKPFNCMPAKLNKIQQEQYKALFSVEGDKSILLRKCFLTRYPNFSLTTAWVVLSDELQAILNFKA
jgi:ERCC4-type nuclease